MDFEYTIFTNLTEDHLDFHKTMENYYQCKKNIIAQAGNTCIINIDDSFGLRMYRELSAEGKKCISFGLMNKNADYRIGKSLLQEGSRIYELITIDGSVFEGSTLTHGNIGLYNLLPAIIIAIEEGWDVSAVLSAASDFAGAPGRMEYVCKKQQTIFYVDYAHTPDALQNVLKILKQLYPALPLTVVFGCGGDREEEKRPIMGRIACMYADQVVLTTDNPRSEDPVKILEQIEKGCEDFDNYIIIPDREEAIQAAFNNPPEQKVVLVAGKGHESYQEIGTQQIEFSDYDVILKLNSIIS